MKLQNISFTFDKILFMIEKLSTGQYAKKSGWSRQLVLYYIGRNKAIPGVLSVEKIAGRNILHTDPRKIATKVQK